MPDKHLAKEMRERFRAALESANLTLQQGAATVGVTVLRALPAGAVIPDRKLPALYILRAGEAVTDRNNYEELRSYFVDVILLVAETGDPQDALDDLQLGVEMAIIGSAKLGRLATDCRFLGSELAMDQGDLHMGRRHMKYEIALSITKDDPRV